MVLATHRFFLVLASILTIAAAKDAAADALNVYIDADFSHDPAVAEAIELGLTTALKEVDHRVAGLPVSIRRLDHRQNPRRSQNNFQTFLRDPHAIAMIGGKQSPPYISYGEQINASRIPLLIAWAAAAPVTRFAEGDENFIFRLSVDDSQAGPFLVEQALADGCRDVGLILADTGWGRANLKTITAALEVHQLAPSVAIMVPSDVGHAAARNIARDLKNSEARCSIAVLTGSNSSTVFEAMSEMNVGLSVLSHWGILGSDFSRISYEVRKSLKLRVLSTCGLNIEQAGSQVLSKALTAARELDETVARLNDIGAPGGFVHGYDLGLLFRAAAEQASATTAWSDGAVARRTAFRHATANLEQPIAGIMDSYNPPFSDLTSENRDGHEGLGRHSLCLVVFDQQDRLVPAPGQG